MLYESLDKQNYRSYTAIMNKKDIRKNEIIGSSINLMYLRGYNGTSVKDITDAAAIPKGSFYNYFEDKEHYAVDAIHYYRSIIVKERFQVFENRSLSPLDRIKEFYDLSILKLKEREIPLGCFVGNITQEMGENSVLISEAASMFHSEITNLIYLALVEAADCNELNSPADLEKLAGFIVSSWQGTLLMLKVTADRSVLDDFICILNGVILK